MSVGYDISFLDDDDDSREDNNYCVFCGEEYCDGQCEDEFDDDFNEDYD